jgi:hypothetical protein
MRPHNPTLRGARAASLVLLVIVAALIGLGWGWLVAGGLLRLGTVGEP